MKKFGTDGIRGIVNKDLDIDTIFYLGKSIGEKSPNKKILIARDNRTSGEYVSFLFIAGVISEGANVFDVGYLSSPGVSYLTKFYNYDYGIMISASHNPPEYNGIKIFDKTGRKIKISEEKELEEKMNSKTISSKFGKYKVVSFQKEKYFEYIKKLGYKLSNITLLADLSNGVTSFYAKNLFTNEIITINNNIDGKYINKNAGILDYNILLENKKHYKTEYALAVDGDGDRIIIIDKHNNILDGDYILYILTYYYKKYNRITNVVGTIQTNLGIEKALNSLGVNLIRSNIGDKNVIEEMINHNSLLGAEQSGHVIIKDYLNTGDGLLTGIITIGIIEQLLQNNEYDNLISNIKIMPQITKNYYYNDENLLENVNVKDYIKSKSLLSGNDYRIIVRKSGSENVIRITVEGRNLDIINNFADEITSTLIKYDK